MYTTPATVRISIRASPRLDIVMAVVLLPKSLAPAMSRISRVKPLVVIVWTELIRAVPEPVVRPDAAVSTASGDFDSFPLVQRLPYSIAGDQLRFFGTQDEASCRGDWPCDSSSGRQPCGELR